MMLWIVVDAERVKNPHEAFHDSLIYMIYGRFVVSGCRLLKNQPRSRLKGKVVPDPFRHDPESAPEADQKEDMDDTPEQPGKES